MDTLIVAMLNALGSGSTVSGSDNLMLTPGQYNSALYAATVLLHDTAVRPITGIVLAIVAVMSISAGASRFDQGDQQLGVRMIAVACFRIAMTLVVTESAMKILGAIDQVAVAIATAGGSMNVGPTGSTAPLGDALKDQVADLGMTRQIVVIVILLLPWLVKVIVGVLAVVLIFTRFLQLDVMTAFASLPIAFAGMDATRGIAVGFVKRYAAVALQGAVLMISMQLYGALMASWLSSTVVGPGTDVWDLITGHIGQFFVAPFVLAFVLFGATSISRSLVGE